MILPSICATPHPSGNRIDLRWENPDPDNYPYVRVVRRAGTHPTAPDDGVVVPQFVLALGFLSELDTEGQPSPALRRQFLNCQAPLTANATIQVEDVGQEWRVEDGQQVYVITKGEDALDVCNEQLAFATDRNLKGEVVYYYTLFPYSREEGQPSDKLERRNRASAMASAPYGMADQMYGLLPRIYHRYDTGLPRPEGVEEKERHKGQLRRFLDLPGEQLDQLYSFCRAMLDLKTLDRVDGNLLPLLADWIGWQPDFRREIDTQRNEVRYAPHLYRTIGAIPAVEATVKRVIGWESRAKEFEQNVCVSNRPERLNLWADYRSNSGEWLTATQPFSLDFAHAGRPAAACDQDGILWLFYHALGGERWDVRYKTLLTFVIEPDAVGLQAIERGLDDGEITFGLRRGFEDEGIELSYTALVEKQDSAWTIYDLDEKEERGDRYLVWRVGDRLNVYHWTPSQPLTHRARVDKNPTAIWQSAVLWVLWESCDESGEWRIHYRTRRDDEWSPSAVLDPSGPERQRPLAVIDGDDGVWLFWLEKVGAHWQLKYGNHGQSGWDAATLCGILSAGQEFPTGDAGRHTPNDVFVFLDPTSRLWVFWARRVGAPTDGGALHPHQTSWQIAYRFLDSGAADWSDPVRTLPPGPTGYDCREPAVAWDEQAEALELFCSSNRGGSWSVWQSTLKAWDSAQALTANPYSQRAPLLVPIPTGKLLVYRSNESVRYNNRVYGATETIDARYAGSTTADTRNVAKLARRGRFEDFQTYTYQYGQKGKRTDQDWYAPDTVGLFVTPDTDDYQLILHNQHLLKRVLRQFLPIHVRVVIIIPVVSRELVYTYDFPDVEQKVIGERVFDSTIPEGYPWPLADAHDDVVPGWMWVHSVYIGHQPVKYTDHRTVEIVEPPGAEPSARYTQYRTWHTGLRQEEENK
jgi:hypothetical protein